MSMDLIKLYHNVYKSQSLTEERISENAVISKCITFENLDELFNNITAKIENLKNDIFTPSEVNKIFMNWLRSKTSDIQFIVRKGEDILISALPEEAQLVLKYAIKYFPIDELIISDGVLELVSKFSLNILDILHTGLLNGIDLCAKTIKKIYAFAKNKIKQGIDIAKDFINEYISRAGVKHIFSKCISLFVKLYSNVIKKDIILVDGLPVSVPFKQEIEGEFVILPHEAYAKGTLFATWCEVMKEMEDRA